MTSVITRTRDTYGRASGLSLSAPGVGAESYSANYSYSPLGRFETIDSAVQGVTNNWQYSYLANSALLSAVSNNMSHSSHRFYEPNRNLLTEIHNTAATNATISTFTYSNDPLGRRTLRIDRTGDSQVALTNDFGYNTRSELTNALMDTESFGYNFDNIGNRELYTTNGTEYTYLVNALNQYTNIVNGITNSPTYDADGNMLTHNGWGYSWSGENRLQTASNATYNASFQYDSQGRRFQKVANGVTNVFVYDGWNLIQERETSATNATPVTTYYTWGLDLSGSMQGAGGIGGLLSVTEATASETNTYFPCFDANGNITEYVDETGTNVVAHYEYGPFGQIIAQSGTKADDFHFRFSTKYYDTETDLYYYGYRYYSPTLGRWPSRDPLEEGGGFNLYAFAENASVLWFDGFGLTIKYLPLPQRTIDYPLVKSKAGSITIDIAYRCTVALKYESGSCDMELLTSKKYQGLDCEVQDVELEFPIPYASIGLVDQLPIPKWVKALIKKGTKGKFKAGFKGRASASGDLLPVGGTVKLKQLNAYSSWKCPKGQHRRAHKLTANAVLSSLEVDLTIVGYFSDKKKDDLYTKHLDDLPGLQVDIDETIWSTCCPCPVKKDEPCQQCGGSGN